MSEDSIGAMRPCPRQTKRCVVPAQALIRGLFSRAGATNREAFHSCGVVTGSVVRTAPLHCPNNATEAYETFHETLFPPVELGHVQLLSESSAHSRVGSSTLNATHRQDRLPEILLTRALQSQTHLLGHIAADPIASTKTTIHQSSTPSARTPS